MEKYKRSKKTVILFPGIIAYTMLLIIDNQSSFIKRFKRNFDLPTLGVCLGYEIIAVAYRGRIKRMEKYQQKLQSVRITKPDDPIFQGLVSDDVMLRKQHQYQVSKLPPDFIKLAEFGPIGMKEQGRSEYILRHGLLERALLLAMTLKEISENHSRQE